MALQNFKSFSLVILIGMLAFVLCLSACGKSGSRPQSRNNAYDNSYYNSNANNNLNNNTFSSNCPYGYKRINAYGTMNDNSGKIDSGSIQNAAASAKASTYQNNQTGNRVILQSNVTGGINVIADICVSSVYFNCALTYLQVTQFDTNNIGTFKGILQLYCMKQNDSSKDYPLLSLQ